MACLEPCHTVQPSSLA
uniref:Uncharacterized protein n=1 Tax=Arundo donax TaxID=35708 RepID=A0A0A9C9C8_ARUDO